MWQNIENASGLGDGLPWLAVAFCAASAALAFALPVHRKRVQAAGFLFALFLAGLLLLTTFVRASAAGQNVSTQWLTILSFYALSAALVTLADLIIFDICLQFLRLRPPAILSDLILAIAYVATGLFILSHNNVNVSGIVATSAVVTAVIGFSLQDTLGNVMGGMAIQLERTIAVGDWIEVNNVVGVVKEIRWRQTSIETRDWDTVVIPNSLLMKSSVAVLGRRVGLPRQHQQYVYFNVDYRYPPTEVIAAVNAAVSADPPANVAHNPPPYCILLEFKDSFGRYTVKYWLTDLYLDEETDSAIRSRVVFALKRQGISMAIPAFRNFQTEDDTARRQRIEEENLEHRITALGHVDLFSPLNEEERKCLAQRLRECPFAADEAMARQGDVSPCMYLIVNGQAEVRLSAGDSQSRTLATLGPNQFFGEMGLLTGDHRSASVVAITDVNCLRLDKEDFIDVLHRRPIIAEHISEILAARRDELNAVRGHLHDEVAKERQKNVQGDLLRKIRHFFRL